VVDVPPGKLGVILANRHDGKGTIVMDVRNNSKLKGRLSPGDKLMAVDGQDVTEMVVSQITSLMASKAGQEQRRLTFISSVTPDQRDFSESKTDVRNY
jgi:C-terminal processing protease CtpA/Prc